MEQLNKKSNIAFYVKTKYLEINKCILIVYANYWTSFNNSQTRETKTNLSKVYTEYIDNSLVNTELQYWYYLYLKWAIDM